MNLSEISRKTLNALPEPDDYFSGAEGWFSKPPHNILVFTRRSSHGAMEGGLHLHPRFVLCWCVETGGGIMVDGSMLRLEPGQCLLIFPFQQHYFSSFRSEKLLWVFVTFELQPQYFLDPLRSALIDIDVEAIGRLENIVEAFKLSLADEPAAGGAISAHLSLLLGYLASLVGSEGDRKKGHLPSTAMRVLDPRIPRVVRHVYENLNHPLMIDGVAETVHTSPSHLRRLFRREMGISLGRFMLQARLNHALSLLHTTGLPVGQIADACGFGSIYSFSRAFRHEKGMAPGAVRRGRG